MYKYNNEVWMLDNNDPQGEGGLGQGGEGTRGMGEE